MDKKSITIVVIIVAVLVVAGGVYYGVNRWRQERLAAQILQEVYGVNTGGGLLNKLTGGGTVANQVAQEMAKEAAKEEAQQKLDEAKEAAKTPEDKYNETKAVALVGAASPVVADEIEPAVKAVFGKTKIISYGTGYMMGQSGSFGVGFKVPRVVTAEDLNKLSLELQNKGYTVLTNAVESESGSVTLMKGEGSSMTFSFSENGENQEVEVLYWQLASQ